MLFLAKRNYLFSSIKNVDQIFSKANVYAGKKNVNISNKSAYQCAISLHSQKLKNLEDKLELMDKHRAVTHEKIIKKVTPKLVKLKEWLCDEKRDLVTVGSVVTGLTMSEESFADVIIAFLDDGSENFLDLYNENRIFRTDQVNRTARHIIEHPYLWNNYKDKISIVLNQSIPVLKLNFNDGANIKLQYNEYDSIKRTNLMRYYATSDSRFRKLYMYINILLKNIAEEDNHFKPLRSYVVSLLVGHFLQLPLKNERAVLPLIPEICSDSVSPNVSTKEVIKHLNNPIDVSEIQRLINPRPLASHLAMQFIDYFANFNFVENAIYIDKINPVVKVQTIRDPIIQVFDMYSDSSVDKSDLNIKIFSESMKYAQQLIKKGYFIDGVPDFNNGNISKLSFRQQE